MMAKAPASVVGPHGGHCNDLLAFRYLVEQFRQHRAVAFAARGKRDGPNVGCGLIHGQTHLAPLAAFLNAMLANLLSSKQRNLIPVLSTSR